jgi:catechol 2,3-dioxygenase-like lactoylglutathione lyase family enzyme
MSAHRVLEVARFTDDVESLKRFYRDLTGSAPEAEWPGGAVFALGDVKVLVHERAATLEGGPANEDHVAFDVDDVDAAFAELRARGHEVHLEPRDYEWGRSAYVRDPDGRIVELTRA